jgi:hypothetical protein
MGEVYALPTWTNHCQADVVTALEGMLERAKAGEITGVAIAATTMESRGFFIYSEQVNGTLLLGSLRCLTDAIAEEVRRDGL